MAVVSTVGSRLFLFAVIIMATPGIALSNQCTNIFGSEISWTSQLNSARELLLENITKDQNSLDSVRQKINKNYNDPLNPHARILKNTLKVQFGPNGSVPSIENMMKAYEQHMDLLVKEKIISKEDVLIPAFVFRTVHNDLIWRTVGQAIPEGARSYGAVIPNGIYYRMLASGYFPIGNDLITPTRISSFEHDLSHVTSFIEHPEYMTRLKKFAMGRRTRAYYGTLDKREYFLGESLTLIKHETKDELFSKLVLSKEMRANPDEITYSQMVDYLNTLPSDLMLRSIDDLKSNFHKYFNYYGGASRDAVAGPIDRFHSQYRVMLSEASSDLRYENRVHSLASLQIILLRLRRTSLDDWFGALDQPFLDPNSPLGKFFKDKDVWDIENGEMKNIFTKPDYLSEE